MENNQALASEVEPEAEPLQPWPWLVREVIRETADVVTLVLVPDQGTQPLRFQPGQFAMLYAFGVGEVPISISAIAADGSALVHTVRDVGMVSAALCRCQPGDVVGVRGPYGSHWPIEAHRGRDIVVAAGGIGLAPVRPILHQLMEHRDAYGQVVLLYGARRPEDLLYPEEYQIWRDRGVQVEVTVDNADSDWTGHVGVITTLIRHGHFKGENASAFICGPEVMMRFTAEELEHRGVPPGAISISMERNMKCAVGFCGHCQLGSEFICVDGPVFAWPQMRELITIREL